MKTSEVQTGSSSVLCPQVEALQAEMRGSSLVCQSSSEQNLQLQHTVQRQQTMLQESTSRVAELEDRQALLLEQVDRYFYCPQRGTLFPQPVSYIQHNEQTSIRD